METTAAYRARSRREMISESYSGRRHAILNFLPMIVVAGIALYRLDGFTPGVLLMVPLLLFLGNLVIYLVHRFPYHREELSKEAYAAHTILHHGYYTDEHATFDSHRDFFAILLPSWVHYLVAIAVLLPLSWLLPAVIPNDYAQAIVFSAALYLFLYEAVHLSAHLPKGHFLLRLPWLGYMRDFHVTHHDPKLMAEYNFGIVFPFWDWILGTHYRGNGEPVSLASGG